MAGHSEHVDYYKGLLDIRVTERERKFQDLELILTRYRLLLLLGGSSYEVVVVDTIWSHSFGWLNSLNMWIMTKKDAARSSDRERETSRIWSYWEVVVTR